MAVVNNFAVLSQLAQRGLTCDPIRPQVLQQTLPPVRALFDDLVEFCLRYAVAPARFDEDLAADAAVAQRLSHRCRQFLAFAGRALIDGNDRHDWSLPGLLLLS